MQISTDQLAPIFKSVFGEGVEISADSDKDNTESWDSLGHLNLIVELEDSLGISFSKHEIEKIKSVGDIIEIIKTK
ncbi:MAG: acyl carrier protein [Bacteroidota bacterium]